jgi:Na+/H+-dicarboxylate symporter
MAQKNYIFSPFNLALLGALLLGIFSGCTFWITAWTHISAELISEMVINLLKLISAPMIFFSVVSTIAGMQSTAEIKDLGKRVLFYTLLTTLIAAFVGLGLFQLLQPAQSMSSDLIVAVPVHDAEATSYFSILRQLIPSNFVQVFLENHVIGVMLIAVVLGLAILTLPQENKSTLQNFFASFYAALLKITHWLVYLMPIAVWAFVTLFTEQMIQEVAHNNTYLLTSFLLYLTCVLGSNLFHGLVVLPVLLKIKKISPLKVAKGMFSALTLAFFSRSSNATLPVTLQCAQVNLGISKRVSNFSLPLGATINMNACASFILITVIYVASSQGVVFSGLDLIMWVLFATLAAIGNAGVPMGCYFLASAFLTSMNVPLNILGMILPIYTFIDMVETALNVWSNACMVSIIDKEVAAAAEPSIKIDAPLTA